MQKVILITGASSGIGRDSALKLINEGHIVYGAARRLAHMDDLVKAGGHSIQLDITDSNQIKSAVDQIIGEQGKIDVLFNNAGYAVFGAVETVSIADAKRQFEVNIFGLAEMTKAVLPHMRKEKSGTIINTSSIAGKLYTPLGAWYHATKHALEGWSDCLRLELKEFNINVVVIQPGAIATEFGDVMFGPMIERAKGTSYQAMTNKMEKSTKKFYLKKDLISHPSVISNLVSKAVNSKRPKTRYIAGKYATPMLFLRKYLSDRIFDRILMSQLK